MAIEERTDIGGKNICAIQKETKEGQLHTNLYFYGIDGTLVDTYSYSNPDEANNYAKSFGATSFDDKGWWKKTS